MLKKWAWCAAEWRVKRGDGLHTQLEFRQFHFAPIELKTQINAQPFALFIENIYMISGLF
jgi:hypothetical protein